MTSGGRALILGGLGSAVGAAVLWALQSFVAPLAGGGLVRALAYTVAGGLPAVLVTFGIAVALHLDEASFVGDLLARLKRRAA